MNRRSLCPTNSYNVLRRVVGLIIGLHIVITSCNNGVNGVPGSSGSNQVHKRFEYKYSFKPPYLAQKDGTVPFFEYSGSKYNFYMHIYYHVEGFKIPI